MVRITTRSAGETVITEELIRVKTRDINPHGEQMAQTTLPSSEHQRRFRGSVNYNSAP
jgi:hypothetical protein